MRDTHALRELQVEMIGSIRPLPEQVKNLFAVAAIKLGATAIGMRKLELGEKGGRVVFKPQPNLDPMSVIKLIQTQPKVYSLDGQDKLRIRLELLARRSSSGRGSSAVARAERARRAMMQ